MVIIRERLLLAHGWYQALCILGLGFLYVLRLSYLAETTYIQKKQIPPYTTTAIIGVEIDKSE